MLNKKSFTYASEDHSPFQRFLIRSIEKFTGQLRLWTLYNEYQVENLRDEETFWDAAIRKLDVFVDYDADKLSGIPKTGPLVVVANHPYGVLDGLIINQLMSRVRDDYKVLTNSVLCQMPETEAHLLEIDFSNTKEALQTNLRTRKIARDLLKKGGAIAVFPAGGVSSIPTLQDKVAQDTQWQPFIASLIQGSKATVVPLFFEGQNSRLFQLASLFSVTLRLSLFFKEVVNKIGGSIRVEIGDAIPYAQIEPIKDRVELCEYLRKETYRVGGLTSLADPRPAYRIKPYKAGLAPTDEMI